jgi:hypothetical protein
MILFELTLLRLGVESGQFPAPGFIMKRALQRLKNPRRPQKCRYLQHLRYEVDYLA